MLIHCGLTYPIRIPILYMLSPAGPVTLYTADAYIEGKGVGLHEA